MNLRWLWLDHIPPELDVSDVQRAEIGRLAYQKRVKEPRFRKSNRRNARMLLLAVVPLALVFTGMIFALIWVRLGTAWNIVTNITGILLFNGLLWFCISWAWYRTNAPYVRWALCRIGKPVCVGCGYILTGADDQSRPCPECGEQRESIAGE